MHRGATRVLGKNRKRANRVVTMWWVLFNKPSECITNPDGDVKCGIDDVMTNAGAGTNEPEIVIMNASGGIARKDGFLRLAAALYRTDSCDLDLGDRDGIDQYTWGGPSPFYTGSSKGWCPADGEMTEIHMVTRDHGSKTDDKLLQLTRFTDPSCRQKDGPNVCVDNGSVGFPTMAGNWNMTRDIGHFAAFPPGCADDPDSACTADQEAVQLKLDAGNTVTLIMTGDTAQVVAEIMIPKV